MILHMCPRYFVLDKAPAATILNKLTHHFYAPSYARARRARAQKPGGVHRRHHLGVSRRSRAPCSHKCTRESPRGRQRRGRGAGSWPCTPVSTRHDSSISPVPRIGNRTRSTRDHSVLTCDTKPAMRQAVRARVARPVERHTGISLDRLRGRSSRRLKRQHHARSVRVECKI